ncbi:MAG: BLUF domain-containing protein [Parasphingorhabdus sp.]|uniref:BLUF domain-containing protein n=1 Tax=Parasphingorhabdus sp. TaxID=2709688 RepID=UPI0030038681
MSQNSIRSLVYISTAKAGLQEADFLKIVESAQRNNELNEITGLLVFNGTNFMQLLEGAPESVNNCMAIIANDPRHNGIVILSKDGKPEREFPDWHMANILFQSGKISSDNPLDKILGRKDVSNETSEIFRNFCSLGLPTNNVMKPE